MSGVWNGAMKIEIINPDEVRELPTSISAFAVGTFPLGALHPGEVGTAEKVFTLSGSRPIRLIVDECRTKKSDMEGSKSRTHEFVLGDPQDFGRGQYLGNGVGLHIDFVRNNLNIRTSLTGLPPVYKYTDERQTILASSIDRIAKIPGVCLDFDHQGLVDLATIGHPISHRTLFKHVSIVPAGTNLLVDPERGMETRSHWEPSNGIEFLTQGEYVIAQAEALSAALQRMDLSSTFLSLTAGLDTRAILALLIRQEVRLPAYTMSGRILSLDARRAKSLSSSLGMQHDVITMDAEFMRRIPNYTFEASRRSGGVESLNQSFEVGFYEALSNKFGARLSGNLGNQIGRSGTEGVGMRGVPMHVFSPDFLKDSLRCPTRDWLGEFVHIDGNLSSRRLVQQENLFASVGNFSLGSSYVVQQTPYADSTVINFKLSESRVHDSRSSSAFGMRARDLRHRLLGDSLESSFQRKIVADSGGVIESTPINWGWRASGKFNLGGYILGALALMDLVALNDFGRFRLPLPQIVRQKIQGFYGFQTVDIMRDKNVGDFVRDTISSELAMGGSVLNKDEVNKALGRPLSDRNALNLIMFAMDVASARRTFSNSFGRKGIR